MLLHLMGILVMMPILFAIFFFLNKNPRFLKNAVFFLAGILIAGVGWAVSLGFLAFEAPTGYADLFIKLVLLANLVVVVGIIYLSRLWKNLWLSGLGVVQAVLLGWMSGGQPGWPVGAGGFLLDHLSVVMLLLVNGVGSIVLVFSLNFMETYEHRFSLVNSRQPLFFAGMALLLGAMNGLVVANNFLIWFLFWQIMVLCGYILITHDRTNRAIKNGRSFVIQHLAGGVAFLVGVVWLRLLTPTLSMSETLMVSDAIALLPPLACFVLAGLVFSSQFPFQSGLIRSITAPLPVSVLLQAVALSNAGIYLIIRLSPLFMNTLLAKIVAVIGAFSFAAAALLAMLQHDTKRLLTLMTISSFGLILALGCFANLQAIYLATLLIFLHGMTKALLFLCIGSHSQSRFAYWLTLVGLCDADAAWHQRLTGCNRSFAAESAALLRFLPGPFFQWYAGLNLSSNGEL